MQIKFKINFHQNRQNYQKRIPALEVSFPNLRHKSNVLLLVCDFERAWHVIRSTHGAKNFHKLDKGRHDHTLSKRNAFPHTTFINKDLLSSKERLNLD